MARREGVKDEQPVRMRIKSGERRIVWLRACSVSTIGGMGWAELDAPVYGPRQTRDPRFPRQPAVRRRAAGEGGREGDEC